MAKMKSAQIPPVQANSTGISWEEICTVVMGVPIFLGTLAVGGHCALHIQDLGWPGIFISIVLLFISLYAIGLFFEEREFRIACQLVESLTADELNDRLVDSERVGSRRFSPLFHWWYVGSDESHHFFATHIPPHMKTYCIAREELRIRESFPRAEDRSRWTEVSSLVEMSGDIDSS